MARDTKNSSDRRLAGGSSLTTERLEDDVEKSIGANEPRWRWLGPLIHSPSAMPLVIFVMIDT
jgi:hypothetical protein